MSGPARRRWDPRFLTTGIRWWEGSVGTTVATGVSSWVDIIASKVLGNQPSAPARPTLVANGIGGQPALNFVPTQFLDCLAGSGSPGDWGAGSAQPTSAFIVGFSLQDAVHTFFDDLTGATNRQILLATTPSLVQSFAGSLLSGTADVTSPAAICTVYNGNSSAIYVNDSATPVVSGASGANGIASLRIGVQNDGISGPLAGRIGTIVFAASALTQTERALLMMYTARQYGLSVA